MQTPTYSVALPVGFDRQARKEIFNIVQLSGVDMARIVQATVNRRSYAENLQLTHGPFGLGEHHVSDDVGSKLTSAATPLHFYSHVATTKKGNPRKPARHPAKRKKEIVYGP